VKTLNVIGCGNVGKALSRLWTRHGVLKVQSILNRSLESGSRAVEFVGSGHAIESYAQMEKADIFMIAASDEAIEQCCRRLCHTGLLEQGVVVFHCSGSLPSTLLEPAKKRGASVASVHPVKSFADPAAAVETFAGTFCALEGDPQACSVLRDTLQQCGAITFAVEPECKAIYHAATVVICNYLVALMEVGLRGLEQAGIPRETAMQVIEPIVRETADNVFKLGPVQALTGPIARGELSVVQKHCQALGRWDEKILRIYQSLGQVAVELAAAQGNAHPDALAAISKTLQGASGRSAAPGGSSALA
jgi:predicted short-subunit dehydrogenase-like oxidoreductase (DUF2520 family)